MFVKVIDHIGPMVHGFLGHSLVYKISLSSTLTFCHREL